MASFKYTARSASGALVNGVVDAFDSFEAVEKIKQTCPVVLSLAEAQGAKETPRFFRSPVTAKALSLVCEQFAIILGAGLPLVQTVELVGEQCADHQLRKALGEVREDVVAGYPLASSFERRCPGLPTTFVETLRAGEASGNLELAFHKLSKYFSSRARTSQKAKSAMIYPAFVIVMAVVVIIVVMTVAMPTFVGMFANSGQELPLATRILIGVSNFFSDYILVIIAVLVALVTGLKIFSKTLPGKRFFATVALHMPVIGRITLMAGAAQFADTMSTMLSAGLPILEAITITSRAMSNFVLSEDVAATAPGVETGRRLGECMARTHYMPNLLVQMTAVGEETGALESTLEVVGSYYDNEVEVATARALALLEPMIIVLLAVFVVLLLLGIYIPMFNMYNAV